MKKFRNFALFGCSRHFDNKVDLAGSEGLECMKVDCTPPQSFFPSSPLVSVRSWCFWQENNSVHLCFAGTVSVSCPRVSGRNPRSPTWARSRKKSSDEPHLLSGGSPGGSLDRQHWLGFATNRQTSLVSSATCGRRCVWSQTSWNHREGFLRHIVATWASLGIVYREPAGRATTSTS